MPRKFWVNPQHLKTVAAIRRELGLDLPMHTRYLEWLGNALQGDFGTSLANRRPVSDLIGTRLGNTLFLALYAAAIAVPLSLALGILAALFRNSFFDRFANASALTAISFPEFFVAYILIVWLCTCLWACRHWRAFPMMPVSESCFSAPSCLLSP